MLHDNRPFVFVTVGTDHHPFDRLIEWVDDWMIERGGAVRARVFVQSGRAKPPRHASWAELVPRDEMQRLLHTAAAVVVHGGPASITECRSAGVVPIVVPREPHLGEHVDDHQVMFTRRLAALGKIHLARSNDRLTTLLDESLSTPAAFRILPGDDTAELATVAEFGRLVTGLFHGDDASRHQRRVRALAGRRAS